MTSGEGWLRNSQHLLPRCSVLGCEAPRGAWVFQDIIDREPDAYYGQTYVVLLQKTLQ